MIKQFNLAAIALAIGVAALPVQAANLTAETTSPGSAPNLSIGHLAEISAATGIADLQVLSGQTLTNSVLNVAEGRSDIASAPLILGFLLKLGAGPYAAKKKEGAALAANLRALWPYNFGGYALMAFDSKGINSWDQLKGKTIYNGPPRGAALTMARTMLQLVGDVKEDKDYKGLQVNWGQRSKTILEGAADAVLIPATVPADWIVSAQAAGKVTIISIPKDKFESEAFQKWATSPGVAPFSIPIAEMGYADGVTVVSEDGVYRTVVTTGAEMVNKSMSNDMAKALTAAYIKNIDSLKSKTPWAKHLNIGVLDPKLSGFCGPNPVKYHPGAVAAWEEAGYKVPDCAKP
ncbi:MAG: TAXI family TRAP transporter solute-binding subunit [Burkholderiaceae bacterium]